MVVGMVSPAAVEIGMRVEYRSMYGHRLSGTIRGVIYGAPKMKRDNITHAVIQGAYCNKAVDRSHDINVIPLKDVWKVR
ncbi:hypothetical protein V7793_04835 [Streptomyces sp. KLMMK]|uniref:hypothetical protein n=1 Tax=Streptomyces sp. KLMMK TaxID=3109353 RepID=UPI003000B64C